MKNARQKRLIRIAPEAKAAANTARLVAGAVRKAIRAVAIGDIEYVVVGFIHSDGRPHMLWGGTCTDLERVGLADFMLSEAKRRDDGAEITIRSDHT